MLINLTPHPITLRAADGAETTIAPRLAAEGGAARVTSTPGTLATVDGIPVPVASPTAFGEVIGLPAPCYECGCGNGAECPSAFRLDMAGALECPHYVVAAHYVVSGIVGAAIRATGSTRQDVLCPGTGPNDGAIRNEAGHIVAVTRLVRPWRVGHEAIHVVDEVAGAHETRTQQGNDEPKDARKGVWVVKLL